RVSLREAVSAGDEHQRVLPKILFAIVSGEPCAQVAGLTDVNPGVGAVLGFGHEEIQGDLIALRHGEEVGQEFTRNLDDLNDARSDFGNTDALCVPAGEENLDGFG